MQEQYQLLELLNQQQSFKHSFIEIVLQYIAIESI